MARLIDGDALIAWIKGSQQMTSKMKNIICYIKTMPTVDVVEVVRCRECKHSEPGEDVVRCGECIRRKKNKFCLELNRYAKDDNGHCSWGVKETNHE